MFSFVIIAWRQEEEEKDGEEEEKEEQEEEEEEEEEQEVGRPSYSPPGRPATNLIKSPTKMAKL